MTTAPTTTPPLVLRLAQRGDIGTRKAAAEEIMRLRKVIEIIRDYYSGSGYIGGMADHALADAERLRSPALGDKQDALVGCSES